jgi:hypothetical protein
MRQAPCPGRDRKSPCPAVAGTVKRGVAQVPPGDPPACGTRPWPADTRRASRRRPSRLPPYYPITVSHLCNHRLSRYGRRCRRRRRAAPAPPRGDPGLARATPPRPVSPGLSRSGRIEHAIQTARVFHRDMPGTGPGRPIDAVGGFGVTDRQGGARSAEARMASLEELAVLERGELVGR